MHFDHSNRAIPLHMWCEFVGGAGMLALATTWTRSSFRRVDDLSRHIDDGGITMSQRSDAVGGNSVMQTMRAPAQGELTFGFGFLKRRKIHRVMVFRIGLRDTRNQASRKNKPRFIGQSIPCKPDQRVFTAARRANDKHKRTVFNIGLLQGSMGHGGQETRN